MSGSGFGREMKDALHRHAQRPVQTGYATAKDGGILVRGRAIAMLEQREVERIGRQMATERGLA
jgi:hypothetical protein